MKNTFTIEVDIKRRASTGEIVVVQNDSIRFIVAVFDNGTPFDLSSVETVSLANTLSNKQTVVTPGTIVGSNTIQFDLGTNETQATGGVNATVQLYDSEGRVSTISFSYKVIKDPTGESYVPSETEQTLIEVVLNDGPLVIQDAQDQANYAKAQGDYAKQVADENKTNFLAAVATVADRDTTYPTPSHGDTVRVTSEAKTYRYVNGTGWVVTDEYNPTAIDEVNAQLADTLKEVKKYFLTPKYIEFFGSFNRFGLGVPDGVGNYTGGNYVLTVSGNAGESFVTVESGDVTDAGINSRWACVVENNDGIFDLNQVIGTDGNSVIYLLEPLKKNVLSKRLGNLHDAMNGQHYTELGYFAFAQHIYFMNPNFTERSEYFSQFKPDDTTGDWKINAVYSLYNSSLNMKDTNDYYKKIGTKHLLVQVNNNTQNIEWEQDVSNKKGYFESYIGVDRGTATVELYLDDVLSDSAIIGITANRVVFEFSNSSKAKVKIIGNGPYDDSNGRQSIYIGLTTWWKNKGNYDRVLNPNDKVVFIGDSWGKYHNEATTRELERLMTNDGGVPAILNFSKSGHTSTYARAWFNDYVIENKPDKVIIEYFTNDFNSIAGNNVGAFLNPDGQQQDMNIASLTEYINNVQYMIDESIKNGIQPIVILPASTNSESQAQSFANYAVQLWLGNAVVNENPSFRNVSSDSVTTNKISSKSGAGVQDGVLPLVSRQISSSVRKGVTSDTDTGSTITNGDIHGFYNNGNRKAGVKHDGTIDTPFLQLQFQTTNIGVDVNNRGKMYIKDDPSLADSVYIILQKADGTYGRFKIQGVFE